jgi:hypothetical protein
MKPVLYVGAMLMVGATIYGFADYKKTSDTKEFKKMYSEVEEGTAATTDESNPVFINAAAKTIAATAPVPPPPAAIVPEENLPAKAVKKSKRKKLNYKEFSRAPLRE